MIAHDRERQRTDTAMPIASEFICTAVRLRSCPKDNSVTNERCRSRLRLEVSFALCNEDLCADVHVSCVMKCVFAKFTEFGSIV